MILLLLLLYVILSNSSQFKQRYDLFMECDIYYIDLFVCLIIFWTLITECVHIVCNGMCQAVNSIQSRSFLKVS